MLNGEQAEAEKNDMLTNREHPVNLPGDIRHKAAVGRLTRLYKRLEALDQAPAPAPEPTEKPLIQMPVVEGAPPSFQWDVADINRQARLFERFGIGHDEFQTLFHEVVRRTKGIVSGQEEYPDREASEATLKAAWGDQFDRKILAARLFWQTLPDGTKSLLDRTGLGNDPNIVKRAAAAGGRLLAAHDRKAEIMADPDYRSHQECCTDPGIMRP
jgi:hypothetical protein